MKARCEDGGGELGQDGRARRCRGRREPRWLRRGTHRAVHEEGEDQHVPPLALPLLQPLGRELVRLAKAQAALLAKERVSFVKTEVLVRAVEHSPCLSFASLLTACRESRRALDHWRGRLSSEGPSPSFLPLSSPGTRLSRVTESKPRGLVWSSQSSRVSYFVNKRIFRLSLYEIKKLRIDDRAVLHEQTG